MTTDALRVPATRSPFGSAASSRAPPTCATVLTMKPVGTRRLEFAGGALGPGVGVGPGVAVGCGVAVGGAVAGGTLGPLVAGALTEPASGGCTIGCALLLPPPLHAVSADASNAAPASERRSR